MVSTGLVVVWPVVQRAYGARTRWHAAWRLTEDEVDAARLVGVRTRYLDGV